MATKVLLDSIPYSGLSAVDRSELTSYINSSNKYGSTAVYVASDGNSYYVEGGKLYQNVYGNVTTNSNGKALVELSEVPSTLSEKARSDLQGYIESSKGHDNYNVSYRAGDGNSYEVKNGKLYRKIDGKIVDSTSSVSTTNNRSGKQVVTNVSAPSSSTTSTSSGDVKGIDEAGITAIKTAIQDFVKGYSSKVSNVGTTTATIQKAVKGTASEKAISNLSSAINSSVMQSLNKLNTFAEQLDTVKSSYAKADSSNTSVSTYTNEIKK